MAAWPIKAATGLKWLLLGALFCGLAGCFDYQVELELRPDGGGVITARYVADLASDHYQSAEKALRPDQRTIAEPEPQLKRTVKGDKVIYQEQASFPALSKLASRIIWFKTEVVDIGLIVRDQPTYRVTAFMADPERTVQPDRSAALGTRHEEREAAPPPTDPVEAKVRALRRRAQHEHYFQFTLKVPGLLKEARSLVVGSYKAVPQMSDDRTSVSWRIPTAVMDHEWGGYSLEFTAVFKGTFAVSGRTGDVSRRLGVGEEVKTDDKGKPKQPDDKGPPPKGESR